jgi:hypothetical protein
MANGSFAESAWLGPLLGSAIILLGGVCVWLYVQLRAIRTRWRDLLEGRRGEDLERLLYDHLRSRVELEDQVSRLTQRTAELEAKMLRTKRFVGVVRYDAFEDVGGSQSFALAMYDDLGNGAIVNSLVGRSDCRVYCKPLAAGKSDRSLTREELDAMERARQHDIAKAASD